MRIMILGSEGAQGKRYQAILRYLGHDILRFDTALHWDLLDDLSKAEGFIIATPTKYHYDDIKTLIGIKKPILCEKPISKNIDKMRELAALIKKEGADVSVVMQYWEMPLMGPFNKGPSFYDYFRHGTDGLAWDCYQIISLAMGNVLLAENSPIWKCQLNGVPLNIKDMDEAYVTMIRRWAKGDRPHGDFSSILKDHEKVAEYERTHGEN